MINVLYIGGYSRAGKTSVMSELTKHYNFTKMSTSDYLNKKTLEYFDQPVTSENIQALLDKDRMYEEFFVDMFGYTLRNAKIHVAEDIIVPEYGRFEGLVLPAVRESYVSGADLVCEVFNHEELLAWQKAIQMSVTESYRELYMSIRRSTEHRGVDGRQLIGCDIDNNRGLSEAVKQILDLL